MRTIRIIKRIMHGLARMGSAAITGFMLLGVLVSLVLLTDMGRVSLLRLGANIAAETTGYALRFTDTHAHHLGWWEFGTLVVSHGEDELARAENLTVRFDVWKLLQELNLEAIGASQLVVNLDAVAALPAPEEKPEATKDGDWPDYPIRIGKLALARISLIHPSLPEGWADYALAGNASLFTPEAPLLVNAELSTLSGTPLQASIATRALSPTTWQIDATLHEDAGGIAGARIGQLATDPLDVALTTQLRWKAEDKALDVSLERLSGRYHRQELHASGALHYQQPILQVQQFAVGYGDAQLAADGMLHFTEPQTALQLRVKKFSLALLRTFGLPVPDAINGNIQASAMLAGSLENPQLAINANADGTLLDDRFTLALDGDGGQNGGRIETLKLTTKHHGSLAISGKLFPSAWNVAIEASQLTSSLLKLWQVELPKSTLSAKLALKGKADAPALSGTVDYAASPYRVNAKLATQDGQLAADMAFQQSTRSLGKANVTLPIATYLQRDAAAPFPLAGTIKASADLAALAVALDPAIHTVAGKLNADLTLAGHVESPQAKGFITLAQTHYQNRELGLNLTGVKLDLKADESGLNLRELRADDGASGQILARGMVRFGTGFLGNGSDINLKLDAKKFMAVNRHDIDAGISGTLTLAGSLTDMTASGTLLVSPLHVLLNQISNHSIPTIDVTEVKTSRDRNKRHVTAEPTTVIHSDIRVDVNQDSRVQGRGLDTALDGSLRITGDAPKLAYDGKFKTVNGSYNLFGRKFVLDDGRIEFQDGRLLLFVPGTYEAKSGTTIRAEIVGTLDDMKINLSSTPPMPQEDIIAWLLFGKSASNVSPFQAIRLANAVQELRGGKSLFDPVSTLQDALKLDNISVESDEDSESGQDVTVGIGKYLSDKVYLEVEKGSNPAQPFKGSVEVELRDNLTLETETGGEAGAGGVGIKWRRDY